MGAICVLSMKAVLCNLRVEFYQQYFSETHASNQHKFHHTVKFHVENFGFTNITFSRSPYFWIISITIHSYGLSGRGHLELNSNKLKAIDWMN